MYFRVSSFLSDMNTFFTFFIGKEKKSEKFKFAISTEFIKCLSRESNRDNLKSNGI